MAKAKSQSTKTSGNTEPWWRKLGKVAVGFGASIGFIGTLQSRWEKHETLNEELEEVILIIGKADHQAPNEDVEAGWWLPDQIDRKIAFILQEQSTAHQELWNTQGARFKGVDSLSSPLTTLRSASLAFHEIEKESHPKEYTQFRAEAKWVIASEKVKAFHPNGLAQLPVALLAAIPAIAPPASKSLSDKPGMVEGIFVNRLPVAMGAGKYPVVDLREPSTQKAMIEKNIRPPEGSRYFIPSASGIQTLETTHGLQIFNRN